MDGFFWGVTIGFSTQPGHGIQNCTQGLPARQTGWISFGGFWWQLTDPVVQEGKALLIDEVRT